MILSRPLLKVVFVALLLTGLVLSCTTAALDPVFEPTPADPDMAYVALRFVGTNITVEMVELTDRTDTDFTLVSSTLLRIVPLAPGDYAITSMSGREITRQGVDDFYYEIPREMMRVIRVREGTVVYIGDLTYSRVPAFGLTGPDSDIYTYSFANANAEYREIYDPGEQLAFTGFVE